VDFVDVAHDSCPIKKAMVTLLPSPMTCDRPDLSVVADERATHLLPPLCSAARSPVIAGLVAVIQPVVLGRGGLETDFKGKELHGLSTAIRSRPCLSFGDGLPAVLAVIRLLAHDDPMNRELL